MFKPFMLSEEFAISVNFLKKNEQNLISPCLLSHPITIVFWSKDTSCLYASC